MKIWDVIWTAQGNLLRNKMRTALTMSAIFVGAFAVIMTSGINAGVKNYIDKQVAAAGGEDLVMIAKTSEQPGIKVSGLSSGAVKEYSEKTAGNQYALQTLDKDDVAKIREIKGLKNIIPVREVYTQYVAADKNAKKFLIGAAYNSDAYRIDMAAGEMISDQNSTPEIALESKYIEPLGFSDAAELVGKTVRIGVKNRVTGEISEVSLKVAGVMNPSVVNLGQNLLNKAALEKLYAIQSEGLPPALADATPYIIARLEPEYVKNDAKIEEIRAELKKLEVSIMTNDEMVGLIKSFFAAMTTILIAFGAISLLVAAIGIINTLLMSVQERTREIGLMKSMGLSNFRVFGLFSCEAIGLSFWGGVLGVAVAFVVAHFANSFAATTFLADLPGFVLIDLRWSDLLIILATLMAIGFLAGTIPALRAAKKNPIDALRYE